MKKTVNNVKETVDEVEKLNRSVEGVRNYGDNALRTISQLRSNFENIKQISPSLELDPKLVSERKMLRKRVK